MAPIFLQNHASLHEEHIRRSGGSVIGDFWGDFTEFPLISQCPAETFISMESLPIIGGGGRLSSSLLSRQNERNNRGRSYNSNNLLPFNYNKREIERKSKIEREGSAVDHQLKHLIAKTSLGLHELLLNNSRR